MTTAAGYAGGALVFLAGLAILAPGYRAAETRHARGALWRLQTLASPASRRTKRVLPIGYDRAAPTPQHAGRWLGLVEK